MKLLTLRDLIDPGYEQGAILNTFFVKIAEYEGKEITEPKYALKLL
jgi:hypothetical protein